MSFVTDSADDSAEEFPESCKMELQCSSKAYA